MYQISKFKNVVQKGGPKYGFFPTPNFNPILVNLELNVTKTITILLLNQIF